MIDSPTVRWHHRTGPDCVLVIKDFPHTRRGGGGCRQPFHRASTGLRDAAPPRAYGSYQEIMADEGVDVVYIATPHPQHHAIALAAIAAGKALVEKTFTATVAGAEQVIAAARQRQVFVMEAMWTRFQPAIVAARALIDDGRSGRSDSYRLILGVGRTTRLTGCSTRLRVAARCSIWASTWCPSRSTSWARRTDRGEWVVGANWCRC